MRTLLIVLFIFSTLTAFSDELPYITNERGDTIQYNYPPHDSTFIHNEIIIKFRYKALNLNMLCYNYGYIQDKKDNDVPLGIPNYARINIMNQRFYVDNIITDSSLLQAIKAIGGDTLRRITAANPCTDTISISRNGDTLDCTDYLWMVLKLKNDTSVINGCFNLTYFHQDAIELAEPNYILKINNVPIDTRFSQQNSLHNTMTGVVRAWDFQTSIRKIRVAVIDDGVDYRHCDFGSGKGTNYKITAGWNWSENNDQIYNLSTHGTPVAGIIGALTNGGCPPNYDGIAGIAGGWGPSYSPPDDRLGCELLGFRVAVTGQNENLNTSYIIAAVREAAACVPESGYGYAVHIINNSYSGSEYIESERAAILYAFENGVSFVASRGNEEDQVLKYPACYDNSWVTNVGASGRNKNKIFYSSYGGSIDLLAPGGYCGSYIDNIVYSTQYEGGYRCFDGTSAAAPHVSGVYALLRSDAWENYWNLEPEDYKGMLKASCLDRTNEDNIQYSVGYDNYTGWGFLQANTIYEMIEKGYKVSHFSSNDIRFGDWSGYTNFYFSNEGRLNKPLATGTYYGYRRQIYTTIILPSNWEVNAYNNLYVWGRSGQGAISGYSFANPNYQNGYSRVTSGTGGNNLTDGIFHSHSLNVTVISAQYDLYNIAGQYIGHIPRDNELALNISVFGKEIINSIYDNNNIFENNSKAYIYPNPADFKIKLVFDLNNETIINFKICNIFGKVLLEFENEIFSSGINTKEINVSNLEQGIYYCKIIEPTRERNVKFIVIK